uniref:Uncharacterized protein n=1 Tax=Triticum urartu TaxID=4572 RepID=A0A8R7U986_TRIUA
EESRQAQKNKFSFRFGWGAPGPASSATAGRHTRAPVASYCGGPSPIKNKFNIVVDTWPTYQILN